jgi:hypothetical protein
MRKVYERVRKNAGTAAFRYKYIHKHRSHIEKVIKGCKNGENTAANLRRGIGLIQSIPAVLRQGIGLIQTVPAILRQGIGLIQSVPAVLRQGVGLIQSTPAVPRQGIGLIQTVPAVLQQQNVIFSAQLSVERPIINNQKS